MGIKSHFTSRFGSEGVLSEFDWTGLGIAGWAFLTQELDKEGYLRNDLVRMAE